MNLLMAAMAMARGRTKTPAHRSTNALRCDRAATWPTTAGRLGHRQLMSSACPRVDLVANQANQLRKLVGVIVHLAAQESTHI